MIDVRWALWWTVHLMTDLDSLHSFLWYQVDYEGIVNRIPICVGVNMGLCGCEVRCRIHIRFNVLAGYCCLLMSVCDERMELVWYQRDSMRLHKNVWHVRLTVVAMINLSPPSLTPVCLRISSGVMGWFLLMTCAFLFGISWFMLLLFNDIAFSISKILPGNSGMYWSEVYKWVFLSSIAIWWISERVL